MFQGNGNAGFALMEVLVVIAVMAILFAAAEPIYNNLSSSAQLNESTRELVQTIREAKTKAIARRNDSAHGVYFSSDNYILYQGSDYSSRNSSYDRTIALENTLSLSDTISGDEINFSRGLGEPSATGTITISHEVHGSNTIKIDSFGSVQR